MAGDFDPDAYLNAAPQADAETPVSSSAPPSAPADGFDPDQYLEGANQDKYGTMGQQALAGAEGAAKGLAGPLATGAERLMGVPAEDIAGRAEANPWTHGIGEGVGLVGPAIMSAGLSAEARTGLEAAGIGAEAAQGSGLFSKAAGLTQSGLAEGVASKAAQLVNLGKVGSTAIKTAIEGGLLQASDEASKYILGQSDPTAPVSSALAHIGGATLLGGTGGVLLGKAGAGLQQIAESKTASKASQFLADFGNRWKYNTENPDLVSAVTDELTHHYGTTSAAADEVYGASGLKDQAIQKLIPQMNEKISGQSQNIADTLQNKMQEMTKDPDTYPTRLTKLFQKEANQWMETATSPEASSYDVFNATQKLKQNLQQYSKFDKQVSTIAPERGFIDAAKEVSHGLRISLEDQDVWGKAGELQQGVNKAFSEFLPKQKDFLSKFTTKVEGDPTIDPGKIRTYVGQLGKPNAEIKQTMLKSYVDASEKYRSKIGDLHESLGIENPLQPSSLDAVKGTLGDNPSAGAKAADFIFNKAPKAIGAAAAHTVGGVGGELAGGPAGAYLGYNLSSHLAPIFEEGMGRKFTRWAVPGVLRALAAGDHEGIPQAANYAEKIGQGTQKINNAVDNVFTIGGQKYLNHDFSETARESLKKYVAEGTLNQQIDNQKNIGPQAAAQPAMQPQGFAHGGEVIAPEPTQPVTKPVAPVLKGDDHLSTVFPEQAMLLGAAKGRINNYLNSIRPQKVQSKMPFDDEIPDKEKDRKYDRALNIANKPLSVLDNIKNGTLDPEHMQHMNQLYPELTGHLQKKLTEKVVQSQLKNEKPPYSTRQSLSLFLGSPMDSTLTPQNIMAAQAVFLQQKAQGQQAGGMNKPKKGTATLSDVHNQYQTADQSLQARKSKV